MPPHIVNPLAIRSPQSDTFPYLHSYSWGKFNTNQRPLPIYSPWPYPFDTSLLFFRSSTYLSCRATQAIITSSVHTSNVNSMRSLPECIYQSQSNPILLPAPFLFLYNNFLPQSLNFSTHFLAPLLLTIFSTISLGSYLLLPPILMVSTLPLRFEPSVRPPEKIHQYLLFPSAPLLYDRKSNLLISDHHPPEPPTTLLPISLFRFLSQ